MLDGAECPPEFWFTNCLSSPFDPFDPTDDQVQNDIIFWANNTSGVVDLNRVHRWRLNTYDYYTGAAYGVETGVHTEVEISIPYTNNTHLAPPLTQMIQLHGISITTTLWLTELCHVSLPVQHNFYTDPGLQLTRTNDTHTYSISQGQLSSAWVEEYEYWFDWQNLAPNTIAGTNSSYEERLPAMFRDTSMPESYVLNLTNAVVNAAGATDAYSTADAIAAFLREGNATFDFKRNYNGSGIQGNVDLTYEFLINKQEGTCSEFTTVFVTMARLAGLPLDSSLDILEGFGQEMGTQFTAQI